MSEREPCQQFVRQWPVGNGEWIDTTGKVCPRCGFMESEHPHAGAPSDESASKSRSVLRRKSALRGEADPGHQPHAGAHRDGLTFPDLKVSRPPP